MHYAVKYDQDLRRSLWSDAISGRIRGPAGSAITRAGQQVVVRSDRGTELGDVLCPASERTALFLPNPAQGEILRLATAEDREQEVRLAEDREPVFATCHELIAKRRLQMDLVDVEMIHGRERVVFYYLAEKRVDFRELVKDLARVLRTRIEMRQIGVRDEAKLLADYGDCGKPVCCNTHLTRMPPVSMKMAKIQKTTLDPAKISGRCGRLKCCLRYEYDTYRTMERTLPAVGSQVVTPKGQGRVVAQEILAQKLVVEFEDQRRIIVGRDDILSSRAAEGTNRRPARPRRYRPGRLRIRAELEMTAGCTEDRAHEFSRRAGPDHRGRPSLLDRSLRVRPRGSQSRQHVKLKRKARNRDKSRSNEPDQTRRPSSSQSKKAPVSGHVSGRELCDSVRRLALRQFGSMAATVLNHWGVRSTSDIGDIVYNLIAAGDLEKTPSDSRSDFDEVFDFEKALKSKFSLPADDFA